MRKATSVVLTTTAVAIMLVGCASPPPEWEDPDPADVLTDVYVRYE